MEVEFTQKKEEDDYKALIPEPGKVYLVKSTRPIKDRIRLVGKTHDDVIVVFDTNGKQRNHIRPGRSPVAEYKEVDAKLLITEEI